MRTLLAGPTRFVSCVGLAQGRGSVELYTDTSLNAPTRLEIG